MIKSLLVTLICLTAICLNTAKCQSFNLNAEELDDKGKPRMWNLGFSSEMQMNYPAVADTTEKHGGKHSIKLSSAGKGGDFGSISVIIPSRYVGKQVVLKGYLKTQNVTRGYAGLWMRLDGEDGNLGFDNMNSRGLTGNNDWKEYSITLPFSEEVKVINIGTLLTGEGTVWADDFTIRIDNRDLSTVPLKAEKVYAAKLDTAFKNGSGLSIPMDAQSQEMLTTLGQVWGFLKYHHASIAAGNHNWDAELMRVVPVLLAAKNKQQWMSLMEKWVDQLPVMPPCSDCKPYKKDESVLLEPAYGDLFKPGYLSPGLMAKLKHIQANSNNAFHYYMAMEPNVGNPRITNEDPYLKMIYPDAGFRLLALYRYWNIINYFFPYRHLIGENWNNVLPEFIPLFIQAKDSTAYMLACLKLIARIKDTHANIWGANRTLTAFRGLYYAPFGVTFIENKVVVTSFRTDTLGIRQLLSKGDIITRVEGRAIEEIIREALPTTPASNYPTQLRDIQYLILRGHTGTLNITVNRENVEKTITVPRYELKHLDFTEEYDPNMSESSYKILQRNIGYIYPGRYKNEQLPSIIEAFKDTKGIVVDMRCYPSAFMPFTFGNYIKAKTSPFVKFTKPDIAHPGLFTFTKDLSNGGNMKNQYKGKVVVIVNEQTQSQAEYTTMAFQSAPNVTVIGSTTAGADGNVSRFYLPGGINTMFSGIGIYYPDKKETQRTGVKIDLVIKPTLKGFREGKDELLDKAIELIESK